MRPKRTIGDYRRLIFQAENPEADYPPLTPAVQVLLLFLAYHEEVRLTPHLTISVPRATVAEAMRITPGAVNKRTMAATKGGYLTKISGGYKGTTATYQFTFPDPQSNPEPGHQKRKRYPKNETPLAKPNRDTYAETLHAQRDPGSGYPLVSERPQIPARGDEAQPCSECEFAGCSLCEGWETA